jgi:hypothetical protein
MDLTEKQRLLWLCPPSDRVYRLAESQRKPPRDILTNDEVLEDIPLAA